MVDVTHLAAIRNTATIKQSHTSWAIRFGRHQFKVTRMREARIIGRHAVPFVTSRPARSIWPLTIGTFSSVSAFGLFVFGAVASEPSLLRVHSRYLVSVPVPSRTKVSVAVPNRRATNSRVTDRLAAPTLVAASGPRFDAEDEPYVAKALRSGELQEWLGSDSQRHFLSVGPESAEEGERCRDLVLLVRQADGSSRTRSARRCIASSAQGNVAAGTMGDGRPVSPPVDENASGWPQQASAGTDESAVELAIGQ